MLELVWYLILPVSSMDIREFSFAQSSVVAMNASSDISLEYAISRPGSALIDCVKSCAQFSSCAGVELCNTTPKLCRLWDREFPDHLTNPTVPQCQRFPKTLRTNHGCSDCGCISSYESWPGVKTLTVNGQALSVPCYQSGTYWWTIIQRRLDGSESFYRDWASYKSGFGSLLSEFWLGNDNIHVLTNSGLTFLRIELMDYTGEWRYAEYSTFLVESEANKYRLTVSGYSGNAGYLFIVIFRFCICKRQYGVPQWDVL
ncbi:fibroleukin-like isoform X2 [Crassostrea virginica]